MNQLINLLEKKLTTSDYKSILNRINNHLLSFQVQLREDQVQYDVIFNQYLRKILGIGLGSTPQSDDVFLGIIATMNMLETNLESKLHFLASYKFEQLTTKESAILIRQFLRKNYPEEIKRFLEIIGDNIVKMKEEEKFERRIIEIKSIGASSGEFFLLGVLWYLRYSENQR
jgi:hypothetical protein